MGIPWKARGMRLSDEQLRWIDEVVDVMAPMLKGRTAAVGWGMGIVRTILTTPSILQAVEQAFQDASCRFVVRHTYDTNSSATPLQGKPGPCRIAPGRVTSRGLGTSQQFTATVLAASVVHRNAYKSPPSGFARYTQFQSLPLGSYSVRERVA